MQGDLRDSSHKMILLPIAFYTIMHYIPSIDRSIAAALSVLCALPSMASIAMIAETQHFDGDYAAGMIFITTLFSDHHAAACVSELINFC